MFRCSKIGSKRNCNTDEFQVHHLRQCRSSKTKEIIFFTQNSLETYEINLRMFVFMIERILNLNSRWIKIRWVRCQKSNQPKKKILWIQHLIILPSHHSKSLRRFRSIDSFHKGWSSTAKLGEVKVLHPHQSIIFFCSKILINSIPISFLFRFHIRKISLDRYANTWTSSYIRRCTYTLLHTLIEYQQRIFYDYL